MIYVIMGIYSIRLTLNDLEVWEVDTPSIRRLSMYFYVRSQTLIRDVVRKQTETYQQTTIKSHNSILLFSDKRQHDEILRFERGV